MLILTRKVNETIQIGDNIEVKILAVQGDTIKIGINAPRDIAVYRHEIFVAIQAENQEATTSNITALAELKKLMKKNQ